LLPLPSAEGVGPRYGQISAANAKYIQQAIGFKNRLSEHISPRTGERLSRGTVFSTLNALRGFFQWLSTQPGYRSHLTAADAEYFALSDKEARIAKAIAERPVPTIDQIRHVLQTMPAGTDIEMRNRAVVAFTLLTGARDGAIASLKLKHVDVVQSKVVQDAREVRTKFSKTFTTWFFPVGEEVRQIVVDWLEYLTTEKLFGPRSQETRGLWGGGVDRRANLTRLPG
jgi:integrase/recombinase XerD